MGKLEKMIDWQKKKLSCHYCGNTRNTQYKLDKGDTEIYICKKCVLKVALAIFCGDIEIQKQDT